jgi:hypothetical protein
MLIFDTEDDSDLHTFSRPDLSRRAGSLVGPHFSFMKIGNCAWDKRGSLKKQSRPVAPSGAFGHRSPGGRTNFSVV